MKCKECLYFSGIETEGKRFVQIEHPCTICGELAVREISPTETYPAVGNKSAKVEYKKGEAVMKISTFRFYMVSLAFMVGVYYIIMKEYQSAFLIILLYYVYYKAISWRFRLQQ